MKRFFPFLTFLYFFACIALPFVNGSAQITHSIIPLIENVEQSPPKKYPETYKRKIEKSLERKSQKIRIVTYNILFDLFDAQLKDKDYCWKNRFGHVLASIENMCPDILCVQEAYPDQFQDLQDALSLHFNAFVGTNTTGELNAIFYKKDRFALDTEQYQLGSVNVSSSSLPLPLNPHDDALVAKSPHFLPFDLEPGRQLTLAHFHDKLTGKAFAVINTHLTYHRINSREDQALFIEKLIQNLHSLGRAVILSGDFNTFPNHPDRTRLPFYDGDYICQIFQRALKDTKEIALLGHLGPTSTALHDFLSRGKKSFESSEDSDVVLDHIFVSPEITVIVNATEPSQINDFFPSDHMPVIADILLP
jgi:endonuclease/exonuclease/phosphatase family metal-dependent hydrolase